MARIRTIKPEFFLDEDLAELSPLHRLFFAGLWCQADCAGRLEDRPKRLKLQVVPYDICDADQLLEGLAEAGFVVRYDVDGRRYVYIRNFLKHQRLSGTEAHAKSAFPGPPNEAFRKHQGSTKEATQNAGREGKGRERKGKDHCADAQAASPPAEATPPRKLSPQQELVAKLDALRLKADSRRLPDKMTESTGPAVKKVNSLLGANTDIGKALAERGEQPLLDAFGLYLEDPYWSDRGSPLGGFVGAGKWRELLDRVAAQGPQKPLPVMSIADIEAFYDNQEAEARAERAAKEAKANG